MTLGRIISRHRALLLSGAAAAVLAFACGDDGDSTTSECTAGYEGCSCAAGNVCLSNLQCIGGYCVDPGAGTTNNSTNPTSATGVTTSNTSSNTTEGQSETGGGEPTYCVESSECPDDQICTDTECVDATTWWYDLSVGSWNPNECAGLEFSQIYFKVKIDGVTQTTSETSDCPGSWLGEFASVRPDWVVELELWDQDENKKLTSFCFRDAADNCTTIPAKTFHDGGFSGPSDTSYISFDLYPREPL